MGISAEEKSKLTTFLEILGTNYENLELLKESLTHKSFANEIRPEKCKHNERLEFLGDAVLELVITKHLFSTYPSRPEGELTSFRAALVRKESLADAALRYKFGQYLYMSRGEEATGGRTREYILANAYEAVLGGIYIDQGFVAAEDFVQRSLLPRLEDIVQNRTDIDAKSKIQELAQEAMKQTPRYELVSQSGPDHNKKFQMGLFVGNQQLSIGEGYSKQEAEQRAASTALKNWDNLYSKFNNSAKIQPSNGDN